VGRGSEQSYCILVINEHAMTDESKRRIDVMCKTTDGFTIAEEDLDIRGPGEFFGTRQSGLPELKLAHIIYDRDILVKARQSAFQLIHDDPQLRAPEHAGIRKKFIDDYQMKFDLGRIG
jgi:ATP-dependent DNA helicase RecG